MQFGQYHSSVTTPLGSSRLGTVSQVAAPVKGVRQNLAATQTPEVRFGFMAVVSKSVDLLENRIIEMLSTDILGMCAPRTAIEAKKRGPDAARETAIRELGGLFGNIFFVGWFSRAAIKLFGNKMNWFNPKAMPTDTWISASSMQAMGGEFEKILKDPAVSSMEEAIKVFEQKTFANLRAADHRLGASIFNKVQADIGVQLSSHLTEGALSPKAVEQLVEHYAKKSWDKMGSISGTNPLSGLAENSVKSLGFRSTTESAEAIQAFFEARMAHSLDLTKSSTEDFVKVAYEKAIKGGLSHDVYLLDDAGQKVLRKAGLSTFLRELKHFREQILDRALYTAENAGQNWRQAATQEIYGKSLRRFLPDAADGLIVHAMKQKSLFTKIPVILSIISVMSISFYNNWLTQKRNGGEVFFPGEGGPKGTKAATKPNTNSPQQQPLPADLMSLLGLGGGVDTNAPLRRPGTFKQFQSGGLG